MTNSQKENRGGRKGFWRALLVMAALFSTGREAISQDLPRMTIEFRTNGDPLRFPLAGGLNSPQFSAVDLNQDGVLDLHVFDRVGNKQLTFLNNGETGALPYHYAPQYEGNFPKVNNWMLLRDYNRDGIMDIFAYSDQNFDAVMVFTGYYAENQIRFRRVTFDAPKDVLYFPLPNGSRSQVYVSMIDYPAVDDVDCDGDLDILTFNVVGGYVEFYANQAVERGFSLDSLVYRLETDCWGGFYESGLGNEVDLSAAPGDCVDQFSGGGLEKRHSGSTLLTLDADGDQDKELILGDISFNEINFLHNGGDCDQAWMNNQDPDFPSYDVSAEVPVFPATFYLDVDNDGLRDLLVAPNAALNADDDVVWWYKNTGTANKARFQLIQKDFLIDEMIDFGSGAQPVFVDYNADGLLDLVVANYSFYEPLGEKNARISLYENTGTLDQPAYQLVDDDYLNFNQFSQSAYAFTPSFGDLDADGDLDVIVGEQNGRLFLVENIAGPGKPFVFAPARYDYMGINVGQASVPQIVDLNRDELPDLIIGERNGNINFFPNQGTSIEAFFSSEPTQMVLGGVDTRIPGFTTGYSSPLIFESAGAYYLITGTEIGRLELYGAIDGNLDGNFSLISEQFGNLGEGTRTHPALADIDNDGWLELAVGNFSGGLSVFQTELVADGTVGLEDRPTERYTLEVWPVPVKNTLHIRLGPEISKGVLSVFNARGQLVHRRHWSGEQDELAVGAWPAGVYWLRLEGAQEILTRKILIGGNGNF